MCDVVCIIISWRHKRRELSYRCQSVENTRLSCTSKNQRWKHLLLRIASDFCCLNMCPAQTHGQWRPWWVDFSHPVYFVFPNWANQLTSCILAMDILELYCSHNLFLSIFFREDIFFKSLCSFMEKRISMNLERLPTPRTKTWLVWVLRSVNLPIFFTKLIYEMINWLVGVFSDQQRKYVLFSYLFLEALLKKTITRTDLTTLQRMWDKHLLSLVNNGTFTHRFLLVKILMRLSLNRTF